MFRPKLEPRKPSAIYWFDFNGGAVDGGIIFNSVTDNNQLVIGNESARGLRTRARLSSCAEGEDRV